MDFVDVFQWFDEVRYVPLHPHPHPPPHHHHHPHHLKKVELVH